MLVRRDSLLGRALRSAPLWFPVYMRPVRIGHDCSTYMQVWFTWRGPHA